MGKPGVSHVLLDFADRCRLAVVSNTYARSHDIPDGQRLDSLADIPARLA